MKIKVSNVNTPNWKEVTVKSRIPVELERLSEIARNIWWAWNFEATELFRDLDPELWKECGQNPVLLLERMSYEKLEALTKDKVILRRMNEVYTKFRDYMDVRPDTAEGFDALHRLAEYFRKSVTASMEKEVAENPHFEMVPPGTRGAYTLELAIISITPTNAKAGIFVTALSGIKGGGLVKRFIKKGHIAMAGRLRDEDGRIVSEFADYEEDHSALLGVDTKDFKKYAHHQRTIDEWAREITDVYSSTYGHWTQKRMISFNPF